MPLILLHQALRIMVYYGVAASAVALLYILVSLCRKRPKKAVRREINHPNGATLTSPRHGIGPTSSRPLANETMPGLEGNERYCNVPDNRVQSENMVGLQQGRTAVPQGDILRAYDRSIPRYCNPTEEDYSSFY